MATEITVPRLGWTMEEGTFVAWLKRDGDAVREGEPLFTLEGDKTAQDVPATDSGVLRIPAGAPQAGATVRVGTRLGWLLGPGEVLEPVSPAPPAEPAPARAPMAGGEAGPCDDPLAARPTSAAASPIGAGPKISPRAARTAVRLGVDWRHLRGTGRTGRIRERDVIAAANSLTRSAHPAGSPAIPGQRVPVTSHRKTIARRMAAGVHVAAPVTLTLRVDATRLLQFRSARKVVARPDSPAPTLEAFIVQAVAMALRQHPQLNAQWLEETLLLPDEIHIALAIDTDQGLVAPVIRNAAALSLEELAAAIRGLIDGARGGRLTSEHHSGATFTVTNLGGLGIETFTPILTLPQCAVLGVGRITREPVVDGDQIVPRDLLPLSLTIDHRAIDGAPAARFLATLRQLLENP